MFADKYLSFSLGLCCLQPGKTLKMAGCLFTQEGFLDIGKKTLKSNESYEGGSIHRLEEKCGSSHLGVMIQRALLKKESKSDNVQGLDVNRTDRKLAFYENKGNLSKLWDILSSSSLRLDRQRRWVLPRY
ncbi:unnamed protein product [Brassica napus]|uniref:(rape) hypothetical protein n=2 Tax=Brassica TaxID=3705 RepID=A0A816J1D8_BRANA|nr:unnamed protein product [Brassica napus]